jgi:drug/metabolite transporter (DMT)-like permease
MTAIETAGKRPSQVVVALMFAGMALTWGSAFMLVTVSLRTLTFGQVTWARVMLGALTLGILVIATRSRLPRPGRVYLHFLVVGVTSCTIPQLAFGFGQAQHVTSALAAMYNSVSPLATAILATLVFRTEALTRRRGAGVAVGVVGVLLIIGPWQVALGGDLLGQVACLGAGVSYAFSLVYMRRYLADLDLPALTVCFLNVGMAALATLLLTPLLLPGPAAPDALTIVCVVLIGVLSTGLAQQWNVVVLRAWGSVSVSTVTYLIPVVAVILGVSVLHEHISWNEPVGAALVLASVLVIRSRSRQSLDLDTKPGD